VEAFCTPERECNDMSTQADGGSLEEILREAVAFEAQVNRLRETIAAHNASDDRVERSEFRRVAGELSRKIDEFLTERRMGRLHDTIAGIAVLEPGTMRHMIETLAQNRLLPSPPSAVPIDYEKLGTLGERLDALEVQRDRCEHASERADLDREIETLSAAFRKLRATVHEQEDLWWRSCCAQWEFDDEPHVIEPWPGKLEAADEPEAER